MTRNAPAVPVLFALGGLVLGLGFGLLVDSRTQAAVAGAPPVPGAPGPVTAAASDAPHGGSTALASAPGTELASLRREVEHLRALLADGREAVRLEDELATAAESEDALELPQDELRDRLLAELTGPAYLAALRHQYAGATPQSIAQLLLYTYCNADMPHEALRILELSAPSVWDRSTVAQALLEAGDRGAARDLFLQNVREDPANAGQWVDQLAQLDPHAGLAALEEVAAALVDGPELRARRAELLLATGDLAGGLDELLREGPDGLDESGWELWFEHSPEEAEAALRELAGGDDPYGSIGMRLARRLRDGDRKEDALAIVRDVLADNPGNRDALSMLQGLDPEAAVEAYRSQVQLTPDSPEAWRSLADQLQGLGRTDEAVEAGLQSFELGTSGWAPDYLIEHAPERTLAIFQKKCERSLDDELWGDLGDTYWRAGRTAEAKAAWERARSIDTSDGEWSGKLGKIAKGWDPFGNGPNAPGQLGLSSFNGLGYFTEELEFLDY